MLSLSQGEILISYTRHLVENHVKATSLPIKPSDAFFHEHRGVFVTLHRYPDLSLRGCIGIPEPVMTLGIALKEAAISATQDPRFPELNEEELSTIIIEVTVLTPPQPLKVGHPKEYLEKIKIGTHGLIIRNGRKSGLLLPQVPVEQQWDIEEYLAQICYKAWLPPDAWLDSETKLSIFTGQIFTETKPYGPVKEKSFA
ncbi:MAG: TIGR00296 family protein [Candidatus Thermoplasmatota archaeon]|nr:TIGR00296 family protein [Candidatus Thermoplasmatota archaeon]